MPLPLPADIQQRVQDQLSSGMFASEDDVLRQAMDTLEKRQVGLARLKEMVQVADHDISAGRVETFNAERTKELVRQRLAQKGVVE